MLEKLVEFIITQFQEHKGLIIIIVIGMVAGLLAQMILPGKGFGLIGTFVIGIAGCWLGNKYAKQYLTFIDNETIKKIISGTLGAMALSLVVNLFRWGKEKDKTGY